MRMIFDSNSQSIQLLFNYGRNLKLALKFFTTLIQGKDLVLVRLLVIEHCRMLTLGITHIFSSNKDD